MPGYLVDGLAYVGGREMEAQPTAENTLQFENRRMAKGFTQIPNDDLLNRDLSVNARFMYALLLCYARQNNECFPGQERLAEDAGVSVRTVRRWLMELEEAGYIRIIQQGLKKPNRYLLVDRWGDKTSGQSVTPVSNQDRTPVSDPDRTSASGQDQTPVADKEYAVEEYAVEEHVCKSQETDRTTMSPPNQPPQPPQPPPSKKTLVAAYEKYFHALPNLAHIEMMREDGEGMDEDVLVEAVKRAAQAEPDRPALYVCGILRKWKNRTVTSMEDVRSLDKERQRRRDGTNSRTTRATETRQGETIRVDEEELEETRGKVLNAFSEMGIDLEEVSENGDADG